MTPRTRTRHALRLLAVVALMGCKPACDNRGEPTIGCADLNVRLQPGQCLRIDNSCRIGGWVDGDAFRLCDAPAGVFVQTERGDQLARYVCADSNVARLDSRPIEFEYVTATDYGVGRLFLTTESTRLQVTATATPPNIPAGGSSQLLAAVSGGAPPFTYAWSPANGLSATDVPNPAASPSISTQYTVVVTDAEGEQVGAAVIVNVGIGAIATADPPLVAVGEPSQLSVQVSGGTPPYSYQWTPAAGLSAPDVPNPSASPSIRTVYEVTVTDFLGETAVASVAVDVALAASASANPAVIDAGATSRLSVAVEGGAPPYRFQWTPAGDLDNPATPEPTAHPTETTTYQVTVTDSRGATATSSATVTVQGAPALQACFTVLVLDPFAAQGDGACSVGAIVRYRWWKDYRGEGQPPDAETPGPLSPVFIYEVRGTRTMRLEVVDSSGATHATTVVFTTAS